VAEAIVVVKHERRLYLTSGQSILTHYRIALGASPAGHKVRDGDGKTPEGRYFIANSGKSARFHRGLLISYPDTEDLARAKQLGANPGGNILIHGLPDGLLRFMGGIDHPRDDWTKGCIAVTNAEIDQISSRVPVGTEIEICP
jgi:murein L,D-transpeptidase YafK